MKWYKNKVLKKLFLETTDWCVGWKLKNDCAYTIIDNPQNFWLADPLIFEDNKKTYLFVEAYDKIEKKGKIAVLTYDKDHFSDFKIILQQPYHLSYPFVFKYKGKYYMIPETSNNKSIEIYQAIKFPNEWKLIKKLINGNYVDTTIGTLKNGEAIFVTYDKLNLIQLRGKLNMNTLMLNIENSIKDMNNSLRCGGRFFYKGKNLCYYTQNNKYFYGQNIEEKEYENNICKNKILAENILNNKNIKFTRLHTISSTSKIEVVDLSNFRFNLLKPIKKIKKIGE